MPEITTITSESLQAEIRRLLPSQRGFGQDLEAQNVIVPIIDLTPTAEGSALRADLQSAPSFGAITSDQQIGDGTTSVLGTPGFYSYNVSVMLHTDTNVSDRSVSVTLSNGLANKDLHKISTVADENREEPIFLTYSGVCFLNPGDSFRLINSGTDTYSHAALWQIADLNGNLNSPSGFSDE